MDEANNDYHNVTKAQEAYRSILRDAIDALTLPFVGRLPRREIGAVASNDMTLAQLHGATALLRERMAESLEKRGQRLEEWRRENNARNERMEWNARIEQERLARRDRKKGRKR